MAQEIKGRRYNNDSVICDCAEPKSIADLRDNEIWFARGCYKKPGCVNVRIKWLQHRKLIFDPRRTPNAYREFSTYSYDIDKEVRPVSGKQVGSIRQVCKDNLSCL